MAIGLGAEKFRGDCAAEGDVSCGEGDEEEEEPGDRKFLAFG